MAIAFVNGAGAENNDSSAPSCSRPAGVASGHVLVAAISSELGVATTSGPTGWTRQISRANAGSGGYFEVWTKVTSSSEPASYSWTYGTMNWTSLVIAAYSGVDTASPVVATAHSGQPGSTSIPTGSAAASAADDWVVAIYGYAGQSSDVITPAIGTTTRIASQGDSHGLKLADAAAGTTSSQHLNGTISPGRDNSGAIIILRAAAGSTPSPVNGAVSATLDGLSLSATGTVSGAAPSPVNGTVSATLDGLSLSATGTVSGAAPSPVNGALAATLAPLTVSAQAATIAAGAWHWTEAERPTLDRYQTVTIGATGGQGYLGVSADGATWSWYAGPLATDGETLTAVASESAARAAPVALPTRGRWRLPVPRDVRYVRLGHRATGGTYTLREFYPRRLIESDDVRAQSIQTLHLGSAAVTTDKLAAGAATIDKLTIPSVASLDSQLRLVAFRVPVSLDLESGIYQGTGTFAAPTAGLKLWNSAGQGRLAVYQGGAEQLRIDSDGMSLRASTETYSAPPIGGTPTLTSDIRTSIRWSDPAGGLIQTMGGYKTDSGFLGAYNLLYIRSFGQATGDYIGRITLEATGSSGDSASLDLGGAGGGFFAGKATLRAPNSISLNAPSVGVSGTLSVGGSATIVGTTTLGSGLSVGGGLTLGNTTTAGAGGLNATGQIVTTTHFQSGSVVGFNGAGLNAGVGFQVKAVTGLVAIRALRSDGSTFFDLWDNGRMGLAGFFDASEIGDPGAPEANVGRLYFRDNGAGKTQLCVRFNTGSVIVLATQP